MNSNSNSDYTSKRILTLVNQGYYYERNLFDEQGHVISPFGEFFDINTCERYLEHLKFGSRKQIRALKSLEFLCLMDCPEELGFQF